jgi:hypothetical protein
MRRFCLLLLFAPAVLLVAQPAGPPVENEYVRVVLATDRPVAKPGALHEHKQNRVMIYLDSGTIEIKNADGRVDDQHWKAGDIAWSPSNGMHTSQNIGSTPVRIVEIELRNTPKTTGPAAGAILDNAQTRVYRSSSAPPAGTNFVAVDEKGPKVAWKKLPDGAGPFVIVVVK